jgi:predicted kinase
MKSTISQILASPVLILIGGGPGAGKSGISVHLAQTIANSVLLDKDRLYSEWVAELLAASGNPDDRDCALYWDRIRPLEYASLERIALDQLRLGKAVVVDAPLRPELDNPDWVSRVRTACAEVGAKLIPTWIEISPDCAHSRMQERAEPRDQWKLENWDEFIRRQSYTPPRAAELILQNETAAQKESAIAAILAKITRV